jgi:hypothetical protein
VTEVSSAILYSKGSVYAGFAVLQDTFPNWILGDEEFGLYKLDLLN